MPTAVTQSLQKIDQVADEGDLAATPADPLPTVDPEDAGLEIQLPENDGPRTIYMPLLMGVPVHELVNDGGGLEDIFLELTSEAPA